MMPKIKSAPEQVCCICHSNCYSNVIVIKRKLRSEETIRKRFAVWKCVVWDRSSVLIKRTDETNLIAWNFGPCNNTNHQTKQNKTKQNQTHCGRGGTGGKAMKSWETPNVESTIGRHTHPCTQEGHAHKVNTCRWACSNAIEPITCSWCRSAISLILIRIVEAAGVGSMCL